LISNQLLLFFSFFCLLCFSELPAEEGMYKHIANKVTILEMN